jgi:hypothetical protein
MENPTTINRPSYTRSNPSNNFFTCRFPYRHKPLKDSVQFVNSIAERYVGKKNAKTYGEVNSGEGAVLVRIKPTKVIAEKDISILD